MRFSRSLPLVLFLFTLTFYPGSTAVFSATIITPDAAIEAALATYTQNSIQGLNSRISQMGPDGNPDYDATQPAVAYNAINNQYLVVWRGDGTLLGDNDFEIWGRLVDGFTAAPVGSMFRISNVSTDGFPEPANEPAVVWNSATNQYLVVWYADWALSMLHNENEIFGQRLSHTGAEIGDDFRISFMGPNGNPDYDAVSPAITWNNTNKEYLVVWQGDTDIDGLVDEELEIWGQRLTINGNAIGANFRISNMGPLGNPDYDAYEPDVVWNATDNQYLVVWRGDRLGVGGGLVNEDFEVWGLLLTNTGEAIGGDFRISQMGPEGDINYGAFDPVVAWNATDNQYLVVWWGDHHTDGLVNNEFEIFGQRLSNTGAEIGGDFRISFMGPNGNTSYNGFDPSVAWSAYDNQYLVVWRGDSDVGFLADNEFEIWGQRLTHLGSPVARNFRISQMGVDFDTDYVAILTPVIAHNSRDNHFFVLWSGDTDAYGLVDGEFEIWGERVVGVRYSQMGWDGSLSYNAFYPAIAYNATNQEYLVVWKGDTNVGALVNNEDEIWGQRVNANSGSPVGSQFRISQMGPDGDANFGATLPAVAWNATDNQYLVVWHGDTNSGSLVADEFEIWGQLLTNLGAEIGGDIRISQMGGSGDFFFNAFSPDVAWNAMDNEYLVVWYGDTNVDGHVAGEYEIWGQRLSNVGLEIGDDFRISTMGGTGNADYDANSPAVAYNPIQNEYLVVWYGDTLGIGGGSLVDGEFEIWGRRVSNTGSFPAIQFRISQMGVEGDSASSAISPDVVWNAQDNQYLVVWGGDTNTGGSVDNKFEIWGQRLTGTGGALGGDFQISRTLPIANTGFNAFVPSVAWDATHNQYLVVWYRDTNVNALVNEEFEVWGQRLNTSGGAIGTDFRISAAGPYDGDTLYLAINPVIATGANGNMLVVWHGESSLGPLVDGEYEIWGRIVRLRSEVFLPLLRR